MQIDGCSAVTINDSRGNPTIEVTLSSGDLVARAAVPSGKSAGSKEALEKRDTDKKGVEGAIGSVEGEIADALLGNEFANQEALDQTLIDLDGTENKSRLGANALLGVSIAAAKLFAVHQDIPVWKYIAETTGSTPHMPRLFMNVINGGVHVESSAGKAGSALPFQEYILVVHGKTIKDTYQSAVRAFEDVGNMLASERDGTRMGDEGGYAPSFDTVEKPFEILKNIVDEHPHTSIAIDAAASEFYSEADGMYDILNIPHSADELHELYQRLVGEFGLMSIEDPFEENDIESFRHMADETGRRALVVGDDLTVTNPRLIERMAQQHAANAVIIKPNQVGTLTETYKAIDIARNAGWKIICSHRSGETLDPFIADLAYGVGAYGLKAGAPTQPERVVKYQRLLQIEQELNL